jgi:hypothetical protein
MSSKNSSGDAVRAQEEADEFKQQNEKMKASEAKALADAQAAKKELEALKRTMEVEITAAKEAAVKEAMASATKAAQNVPPLNLDDKSKLSEKPNANGKKIDSSRKKSIKEKSDKKSSKTSKGQDDGAPSLKVPAPKPEPISGNDATQPPSSSSSLPAIRPKDEKPSQSASPGRPVSKPAAVNSPSKKDYSVEPLPEGWERRKDPNNNNRSYYVDHTTKRTSWDHPLSSRYRKSQKMATKTSSSRDDVAMSKTLQTSSSSAGFNSDTDDALAPGASSEGRPRTAGK